MMNDQILILNEDEQENIGTAGKIGLGAAAVVLVGVALLAVLYIDCESSGCGSE